MVLYEHIVEATKKWDGIKFSLNKQLSNEEIREFRQRFAKTVEELPRNQQIHFFSKAYDDLVEYSQLHGVLLNDIVPEYPNLGAIRVHYGVGYTRLTSQYFSMDEIAGTATVLIGLASAVGGALSGGNFADYLDAPKNSSYIAAGVGTVFGGLLGAVLSSYAFDKAKERNSQKQRQLNSEEHDAIKKQIERYIYTQSPTGSS